MGCLDENQVFQYVGGLLSADEEAAVEQHVARCDACRWLVSAAGAAVLDDVPTGEATRHRDLPGSGPEPEARRVGEVLQDTYVVERFIGQGGTGVVYEAAHRRLPRRFAIKFLSSAFAADRVAVGRMQREAEVTSRLSHPNIVDVVDFNRADDGTPFIAMELLHGEPLSERLRREGAINDLGEVGRIIRPVAAALGAAHDSGVVHRDLKPSNIFLCDGADGRVVKVVDFGIAKVVAPDPEPAGREQHSQLTRVCAVVGTPAYMSPEQAEGRSSAVDARADIFSLGAIIFRMLTGVPPFRAETLEETLRLVSHGQPAQTARWRALPGGLRRVILRALSKDPGQRQLSMAELWAELAAALGVSATDESGATADVPLPAAARPSGGARPRVALLGLTALLLAGAAVIGYLALRPRAPADGQAPRWEVVFRDAAAGLAVDAAVAAVHEPPADAAPAADDLAAVAVGEDPVGVEPGWGMDLRRHRKPRPPRIWGSLVVQSKERATGRYLWADVYLDGKRVGQTALTLGKVRRGAHVVRVQRPGYAPAERRISIAAGKQTVVRFALRPRP